MKCRGEVIRQCLCTKRSDMFLVDGEELGSELLLFRTKLVAGDGIRDLRFLLLVLKAEVRERQETQEPLPECAAGDSHREPFI